MRLLLIRLLGSVAMSFMLLVWLIMDEDRMEAWKVYRDILSTMWTEPI